MHKSTRLQARRLALSPRVRCERRSLRERELLDLCRHFAGEIREFTAWLESVAPDLPPHLAREARRRWLGAKERE